MTGHEHSSQRDRVSASLRLQDTPEARHGTYSLRGREMSREAPTGDWDDVERNLAADALLYAACSGDFTQAETDMLTAMREQIRPSFSRERRARNDLDTGDGLGA